MIYILNKKTGILIAIAIFSLLITGCDDAEYSTLDTHAYIAEAQYSYGSSVTVEATGQTITSLNIKVSDKAKVRSTFKLVPNHEVLDEYNKINGTDYVILPEEYYKLPEEIIIEEGKYDSEEVKIGVNSFSDDMLASGKSFAIPLKLESIDGNTPVMNKSGRYVLATGGIIEFSAPMFTNSANLHADKFDDNPETYSEYTIEVRFQVSNTGNRDRAIYKSGGGDDNNFILLRFEDPQSNTADHKKHSLVQVVGRNRVYLNPLFSFEPNKWQHLALVCDGSSYRLYINGKDSGVKEIPSGPTKFFGVNWFTGGDSGGDPWTGCKILMSEARIWSVSRTELQIQNNMTITNPESPGLEAYWRFNEGEGNVFQDATGNGHTLRTSKQPLWIHEILSTDEATPWQ